MLLVAGPFVLTVVILVGYVWCVSLYGLQTCRCAVVQCAKEGTRRVPDNFLHRTGLLLRPVAAKFLPMQRICREHARQYAKCVEGMRTT